MTFSMLSQKGRRITVECDGVRDIASGELIHYTVNRDALCICLVCGGDPVIWTDDEELWQRSKVRCL